VFSLFTFIEGSGVLVSGLFNGSYSRLRMLMTEKFVW
jgi:hypothetical protein